MFLLGIAENVVTWDQSSVVLELTHRLVCLVCCDDIIDNMIFYMLAETPVDKIYFRSSFLVCVVEIRLKILTSDFKVLPHRFRLHLYSDVMDRLWPGAWRRDPPTLQITRCGRLLEIISYWTQAWLLAALLKGTSAGCSTSLKARKSCLRNGYIYNVYSTLLPCVRVIKLTSWLWYCRCRWV